MASGPQALITFSKKKTAIVEFLANNPGAHHHRIGGATFLEMNSVAAALKDLLELKIIELTNQSVEKIGVRKRNLNHYALIVSEDDARNAINYDLAQKLDAYNNKSKRAVADDEVRKNKRLTAEQLMEAGIKTDELQKLESGTGYEQKTSRGRIILLEDYRHPAKDCQKSFGCVGAGGTGIDCSFVKPGVHTVRGD